MWLKTNRVFEVPIFIHSKRGSEEKVIIGNTTFQWVGLQCRGINSGILMNTVNHNAKFLNISSTKSY